MFSTCSFLKVASDPFTEISEVDLRGVPSMASRKHFRKWF